MDYSKALDAQVTAEPVDDKEGPIKVCNEGKNEEGPEVKVLGFGCKNRINVKQHWYVDNDASRNKRDHLYGEHGERRLGNVRENDLGGHPAKHDASGQGKKDKVVVGKDVRIRRREPVITSQKVDGDGNVLDDCDAVKRFVLILARLVNMIEARRCVKEAEKHGQANDEDVKESVVARDKPRYPAAKEVVQRLMPDPGSVDTAQEHDETRDDQTLGRSVDITEVENAGMVFLPSAQVEWQRRQKEKEALFQLCRKPMHPA